MKRIRTFSTSTILGICLIVATVVTLALANQFKSQAANAPTAARPAAVPTLPASAPFLGLLNHTSLKGPLANYSAPLAPTTGVCSGTRNIPGDYADLATAITDINTNGVLVAGGGCVLNLIAGNPQTAPAGGYSINVASNPPTVGDPLTIQGNSNTITASAALTVGALNDAIFKIIGSDFVTITGFTMQENAANTVTTAASNTMTEWGVALLYATTTNGAQNITIQNNTITLNRTYQNTFGIYSNSTHSATAVTTSATATTTAGGNSNLKIYGNTISNVNQGISVVGPTAAADMNTGLDIGGTGGGQANSITNWGTTGTFSGYANVSGTLNCILVRNSIGFNVSFNTLTSSVGGNTATTSQRAIYVIAFSIAPTGTFTNTINSNNISVQSGFATGTLNGIINETTTGTATSSLTISSNNFNTWGHTVAASGAATFINSTMAHLNTTINSNTFTAISLATTGSVTFISNSVTVPATGSQTINSNSIVTSFTRTSAGSTTGITTAGSSTTVTSNWNNNTFSNITLTGASSLTFINQTDGGSVNHNITGNTFSNITGGTSAITGIISNFGGGNGGNGNLVSGNTISNISSAGAITGIQIGSSGTTSTVTGNTVNTLASTGASLVVGITSAAPTSATILKNKVYDLSNSNASGTVSGIAVTSGTLHTVSNNLIGDLRATAANAANPLIGLNITGGTTVNAYFNTVYLNGMSSGALFGSSAVSVSTTPTVELRDNVFVNASTVMGAGLAAAHRRSTTTLTTYAAASNNNDFFGSTSFTDGTNTDATIAAYKARVAPRDSASFAENPPFLSTSGASAMFLHISAVTPTQLESGGSTVAGITDDFDGNTRNVTTPDVGADEFTGTPLDLSPPVISYTTLGNGAVLASRAFSNVTVTDATGVNTTAGTRPRVYYRKTCGTPATDNTFNDNTNATPGWKFAEATGAGGSPFSFTIAYSLLPACGGGSGAGVVATGDVIQYFVVAQDTVVPPNVGINSGTFTLTPASVALTAAAFPIGGTINSYNIVDSLTGTKTVCASGCDYMTLTAAGGVFADINAKVVTGNLTIQVAGDLTVGEDGTNALNAIAEEPAGSNFTVTMFPTGMARAITSTTAPAGGFIRLNAADRVTIDGSIGGTGTDRSLTITEANTGTTSAAVWLQSSGTDGATSDTIKNLNVVGNSNTTTLIGIGMGTTGTASVSLSSLGTNNNTNTIQNNNISKTQYGIYSQGASTGTKNTGNVITQNLINTVSPNNVAKGGIIVGFENSIQVTRNTVSEIAQTTSPDVFGISLGIQGISTSTFTGNEVTNATVSRNFVGSIRNTGTFSACGICVAPATSGTNQVSNNALTGVSANGTSGDFSVGILIGGGVGSTTQVYFNSVSMNGTQTGGSDKSYALAIGGSDPIVDVRNNALYNTQNNGTGNNYAVAFGYSTFLNLTSNNNDFFVTSPSALHFVGATASISAPTNQLTLANLQTATGKDGASIAVDPLFNNPASNLQPQIGSPLVGAGTTGTGVLIDILGVTRSVTTPTIGAYENAVDSAAPAISYTAFGNTSSTADRILTPVNITDVTGIPTMGSLIPRIYYKKNAGSYFSQACALASGTATNSNWDCTIVNADMGGVVIGDVISYFVIAQDTLGNVGSNPSAGLVAANVNTVTTPPTTPNTYLISQAFTGSYNVGTGEIFPSLTNAGGIFQAMNVGVLTGNVTINITTDLMGELGTFALNQQTEQPAASNFTVTIKPSGAARMISGSSPVGLIALNGADRVTIDGSLSGGSDRSLTITNTNTGTTTTAVIWGLTGPTSTGAQNNTVKNVNLVGNAPTTTAVAVGFGGNTVGTGGADNDGNRIQNCDMQKSQVGIYTSGISAANKNTGTVISGNTMTATGASRVQRIGMAFFFEDGIQITQNTISGLDSSASLDSIAIAVGVQNIHTSATVDGEVTNATITRNNIGTVSQTATFSAGGITLGAATSGTSLIANNMISGVIANATSPDIVAGIYYGGGVGSTTRVYHNSVSMTGARGVTAGQYPSFALAIGGSNNIIDVEDNLLVNTQTQSGGGALGNSYAIGINYTTAGYPNVTSNFNDFMTSGAQARFSVVGGLSNIPAGDRTSLGAWQTETTKDAASISADPVFISTTDLHLQATSPALSTGTFLASVPSDFDNDPRPGAMPDMGADEIVQSVAGSIPAGTYYNAAGGTGDSLGGNVTVTNAMYLTGMLSAGANTLTIDCNGVVFGASAMNYISGNLARNYCGTGGKAFDVGTANGYSPVNVNATAGTFPATFTVKAVQGPQPSVNPATSIQRYWTLTNSGLTSANLTVQYLAGDVMGTETLYKLIRVSGGTPVAFPATMIDTMLHTATLSGVTSFSDWTVGQNSAPSATNGSISGRLTNELGSPLGGAAIRLSGTQNRLAITDAAGAYHFDGVETNGFYTVTPSRANYTFSPANRSFSLLGVHTEASFTGSTNGNHANAIDTTEFFVRQHYLDFLGREPEEAGLTGWVNTIRDCPPGDLTCDYVHVSESFFRSEEFHQRGYFVYRFYSTALGRKPDYAEFTPDLARVNGFLTEEQLEAAKVAFVNDFMARPAFAVQYNSLSNAAYVDALINIAQVNLPNRQALVDSLDNQTATRAVVLRQIVESDEVDHRYYNQAFVVMEYFGYLHRDPDALYTNWIAELDRTGSARHMVEGFVNSAEYRNRFAQ